MIAIYNVRAARANREYPDGLVSIVNLLIFQRNRCKNFLDDIIFLFVSGDSSGREREKKPSSELFGRTYILLFRYYTV